MKLLLLSYKHFTVLCEDFIVSRSKIAFQDNLVSLPRDAAYVLLK